MEEHEILSTDEWNPLTIGGSSAASCVGLGRTSMLALYERLRGGDSAREWSENERERLELGRTIEPAVITRACKRYGYDIRLRAKPLVHPRHPKLVGHIDGYLADGSALVEIKMAGSHMDSEWGELDSDQVPADYLCQGQHYLMLEPNADKCIFLVLRVPSFRLERYIVPADLAVQQRLMAAELDMLDRVVRGRPPDPATEAEARSQWFAAVPEKTVQVTPEASEAMVRLWVARKAASRLEKIKSGCSLTILSAMQDAAVMLDEQGTEMMTAKNNRAFDSALFRTLYAEQAAECLTFDGSVAAKKYPHEYYKCMKGIGPRQLRFSRETNAAMERMVSDQPAALPYLSEIAGVFHEEATNGE